MLTFPTHTLLSAQADLPSVSFPAGFTDGGVPAAMEIVGRPYDEAIPLKTWPTPIRRWPKREGPRERAAAGRASVGEVRPHLNLGSPTPIDSFRRNPPAWHGAMN